LVELEFLRNRSSGEILMQTGAIRVEISLGSDDGDDEHVNEDQPYLLDELLQIDGVSADLRSPGPAPMGTKSGGSLDTAALVVALGGSGATLPMLVGLARDWLQRRGSGSVRLKIGEDEIEITRTQNSIQQQALDAFLRRHGGE
jgi:hypothetical protein